MSEKFSETDEGKKLWNKYTDDDNFNTKDLIDQAFQEGEKKAFDEANKELIDFCESIKKVDRTPKYGYAKKGSENNEGEVPGTGSRWLTPRELAEHKLREAEKLKEKRNEK